MFPTNFENFVTWIRIMNTLNFPEQILAKQKRYYDDVYDRFSNVFIVSVISVFGDSMVHIYSEKC